MQMILTGVAALLILMLCVGPVSCAPAQWRVHQAFELKDEPLDMLMAPRSRQIYVLNGQGEILIYAFDGSLKGKVDVGDDVTRIKAGPSEGMLFIVRRKSKTIQVISIDLVQNISIQDAPFKGMQTAPVTIAVFSDFQ